MRNINGIFLFSVTLLMSALASAAAKQVKCAEVESYDSIMMKEYNGPESEGVLIGAKPNDVSGNIGDYTIIYDSDTKQITGIMAIRKTSGFHVLFNRKNSTFSHRLEKLLPGAFDGDCLSCRTHFEVVEATHNSTGDRISIKIDDHGVYPDLVASSLSFKIGGSTFDLSAVTTTEMSCDSTVQLTRPQSSDTLEDDLLD